MKKILFITILCLLFPFLSIQTCEAEEEILIIFDASLSMGESVSDEPKYIIALEAVKNYLNQADSNTKIGFRIIGLQLNQNLLSYMANPEALCRATKLLNPISYNNTQNIMKSLENVFPLGVSPLTYSIKTSIDNDFSAYANPKHIILITDGAESCDENPCLYARQLASQRSDVKIDIFAIDVSSGDLVQLKCISDYLNGSIYNIKNSREFDAALKKTVQYNKPDVYQQSFSSNNIKYKNYLIETLD